MRAVIEKLCNFAMENKEGFGNGSDAQSAKAAFVALLSLFIVLLLVSFVGKYLWNNFLFSQQLAR